MFIHDLVNMCYLFIYIPLLLFLQITQDGKGTQHTFLPLITVLYSIILVDYVVIFCFLVKNLAKDHDGER